jgi:diadenylate cyclase
MLEGLHHLFVARPWTQVLVDIADLLIVAYVVYRALLVLRGTRAMQMGTGLGVIFVIYAVAKWAGLVTLYNLLSSLLSSIILIVVVVFQNDIRRGLMRVGSRAFLAGTRQQESRVIDEVVAASTELARHRIGALICFEQDANLDEFVVGQGTGVDAQVQRDLLVSMFIPEGLNKLHDGAVVIRNLRIAKAGVFFPMPDLRLVDKSMGSRHRAALGISEETDAVIVVVSEERGTISLCFSGNIVPNLDGAALKQALQGLFGQRTAAKKRQSPVKRMSLVPAPATLRVSVPPVPPFGKAKREKLVPVSVEAMMRMRDVRTSILPEDSVPVQRVTDPTATRPMQPAPTPLPFATLAPAAPGFDRESSSPISLRPPSSKPGRADEPDDR